jgi:DNA repair protein RadD
MLRFESIVARADDDVLQALVGRPSLRLIGLVDRSLLLPSNLRQVVLNLYSPEAILTNNEKRAHIIDLLRPDEAHRLAQLLDTREQVDVFDALRSARINRKSKREELLFAFFGLDVPEEDVVEETPALSSAKPAYPLFPHQRNAIFRVKSHISTEPRRVLLHMPTGAGKTRTTMNIIADHLRVHEPSLVIWLAYSEELCEQAASEFEQAWYHLGNRSINMHRYWGHRDLNLEDVSDGLIIAGLGKMYSTAKRNLFTIGQLGSRSGLVVIDEAHQAIAPTYRLVLDSLLVHYRGPGLLGLTATPGRTWSDIAADEELADFFGRKKVMLEVEGYDNPVQYLVEEGYLASTSFEPLHVASGIDLSPADLQQLQTDLDIPDRILRRLAEDEMRNLAIVNRLRKLVRDHRRIIVFAATVQHAELLSAVLQACGIDALSVTGQTPGAERTRRINRYKEDGTLPVVLCNYGVLTTGFDAPKTSAALIARPTKSLVLYSQMVGRATRGPRAGGNSKAEIITVVDSNLPGFGNVAEAFTNWEDVWN